MRTIFLLLPQEHILRVLIRFTWRLQHNLCAGIQNIFNNNCCLGRFLLDNPFCIIEIKYMEKMAISREIKLSVY